ncbi:calponin homology domain-containing protein DDB_G0272472-like isoform X2 [Battus philenor]|uniref:calponin homology domain-containing protein DDB_G0272472-like isoform X2 n=1 Tax=Battus philenor TaxID=42288 RepID=UPI0035D13364
MNQAWKKRFCWVTRGKLSLLWAELVAAVRRRGRGECSDDEEDLGLPRSPPASPPTDKAQRHHAGISQSSCSDGSLLSVGSSEMDEDSSSGHHHSHDHSARSDHSDVYNVSEPPPGVAPLSHSAARHKMAVRPRRTHGAPRRKKANPIAASALPITPELNEEMIRSTTPDVTHKTSEVVTESFSSSTTSKHQMIVKEQHQHVSRELQRILEPPSDTKMKSSSLPPGLALGQVVGQSPAKLSIAESNTPRSSIKRSKSSTQDQPLRENSPRMQPSAAETQIHTYHSEERTKYRLDKKYAEDSCHEKKSKSEKKIENEVIKSKKEESFFSRLLLRKSGKKSKKDQTDGECQEVKKTKTEKSQYKVVDADRNIPPEPQAYKPVPAERSYKSAGQKAFANQLHKRMDKQGAYINDGAYKDIYSAAKVPGMEYNITDLKIAEETDTMLNLEMKSRFSRREEFSERVEKKRTTSKEAIDDKRESFNLNLDKSKRPVSVQRLMEPLPAKSYVNNELSQSQDETLSPSLEISDDEPPVRAVRVKKTTDYTFHSGSMPKNLPYFNPSIIVSSSPPKISQSTENVKKSTRSSENVDYREKIENVHSKTEESYVTSGLRSLGDEYVETRSSIGKSHSFRYASESTSISSQENQLPSLPAIVGISEPLLESWEVNYRRNVERHDYSKRVSARNYNIVQTSSDTNFDSLMSTDSSYLDSLKTEEDRKLFTNSIHITMDTHKRDSDISQIEAKIDDIISSPKPLITPIIKSSSLDSVKSSPEKPADDRRKTISVETALSQNEKSQKENTENFISVTVVNRELTPIAVKNMESKTNKSEEKLQKPATTKSGVPEFLNIQLNKVDVKPVTNVVLTANVTPKKDSPQLEKEQEFEAFPITETKILNIPFRETGKIENLPESYMEEKSIPKTVQSVPAPKSPSTPRNFFKRKATSVELQDKPEKARTSSLSTEGSTEKIFDNISMDRKSHSSFGSKSSIQSTDSSDNRIDRQEETVVYRKKLIIGKETRDRRADDEPELMKVFARRSLKIKDTEADSLAQEIADAKDKKDLIENTTKSKILKNEFNASIKSRDSDKENEGKDQTENKLVDIAARVSQFGVHYQRSVSIHSVANVKRESAPVYRSEMNRYKKEISDSTPEKRLRNRTFPDPSNDRDMANSEAISYKADTLTKRPWQRKDEFRLSVEKEKRDSAVIEMENGKEKVECEKEKGKSEGEADASPQFKGILQMRAEWERRAKQGMTK